MPDRSSILNPVFVNKTGDAGKFTQVVRYQSTGRCDCVSCDGRGEDNCTGRISRSDKRGAIHENALPILERLNLDPGRWSERATRFEATYQQYRRRAA